MDVLAWDMSFSGTAHIPRQSASTPNPFALEQREMLFSIDPGPISKGEALETGFTVALIDIGGLVG